MDRLRSAAEWLGRWNLPHNDDILLSSAIEENILPRGRARCARSLLIAAVDHRYT
jgi:hypothetical protein